MGRPVGVVTVEVVVRVPAPALRRAVEGRGGAVVVVAVVTGRVRVEVTGRGRLVVVGRVWVAVVVVMDGGGGGAGACHGRERKRIQGIVHIDRVGQIKLFNLSIQLACIHRSGQFGHHVRHCAEISEDRG